MRIVNRIVRIFNLMAKITTFIIIESVVMRMVRSVLRMVILKVRRGIIMARISKKFGNLES